MNKVKLGELLDVRRGMSLSGEYYAEEGSLIRLTLGNFNYPDGGFKANTAKTDIYFIGDVKEKFVLKKGDIITPLTEQVAGLLGETALIPVSGVYVQSSDVGLVVPDESKVNRSFARYLISSPSVKKQLGAAAQQTKIRHTSPDAIKECVVYVPDLSQQAEIGCLLGSLNSQIQNQRLASAELASTISTIYDYWFAQFDFPDEHGRPYRTSGGKMVYSEELKREIPDGWEVGNFYSIAQYINGLACQKHRPSDAEASLPVVKIKEMHEGISSNTERVSAAIPAKNIIDDGDLLFSWSASLEVQYWIGGKAGLNQHIFKVDPIDYFTKEYVYQQLSSYLVNFKRMAAIRKTTTGHITADHLSQGLVALPPKNLVDSFSRQTSGLRDAAIAKEIEIRELRELRNWLLPMLMNGQVILKD